MKTCFIIMPISDHPNYSKGHFNRVYEHIIKPACKEANFEPIRADDIVNTNHIALDIVKRIIESDMALCDLSSRNPNVLYELGIRQAFNKPVTLIKDSNTNRIFDIQGFRDLEYDENLRIDTVNSTVELLATTLTNTYNQDTNDVNSLIKLLGIRPAKIEKTTKISSDTELILSSINTLEKRILHFEEKEQKNNLIARKYYRRNNTENDLVHTNTKVIPLEELLNLKKDDRVFHKRFGEGKVIKIDSNKKSIKDSKGEFLFEDGEKRLLLRFANLQKFIE